MASIDPVTVSVVQHRLRAIVEEMGEAMLRTSYSQILDWSRDFSTALGDFTRRVGLLRRLSMCRSMSARCPGL